MLAAILKLIHFQTCNTYFYILSFLGCNICHLAPSLFTINFISYCSFVWFANLLLINMFLFIPLPPRLVILFCGQVLSPSIISFQFINITASKFRFWFSSIYFIVKLFQLFLDVRLVVTQSLYLHKTCCLVNISAL